MPIAIYAIQILSRPSTISKAILRALPRQEATLIPSFVVTVVRQVRQNCCTYPPPLS